MSDLPGGWEWTTIGEIADTSLGKMLDKKRATGLHPTPYLRNMNVRWGSFDLSDLAEMDIRPDELGRVLAEPGDVVACEGGEPGRAAVWRGPGKIALQKALHRIRPSAGVLPGYLALLLQHLATSRKLDPLLTGTTIKHLPQEKLRRVPVPLPPSGEQERIVAAVEEHLSRLDAAEGALRSARHRLDLMRARGLDDLTNGDWQVQPLGEVLVSLRNGCFVSRPKADPPGLPIFRISAVRPLELDITDIRYAPTTLDRATEFQVEEGDLLFTRYSGNPDYVGACARVPPQGAGILYPDKLIRGVPDASLAHSRWIALVLTASAGRREIAKRLKTTAGQVGIAGSQLRSVPIPVPSLEEQADRLGRWDHMNESIQRLRSGAESAAKRAHQARRAVLAAAFSGQLVSQDPTDEPTSVLLDRIRVERAAATPVKRTRRVETP